MRQNGYSLPEQGKTGYFVTCAAALRVASDGQVPEQRELPPAFHGTINAHRLTATQWRIQKLFGMFAPCRILQPHIILLPEFSPSSALLSNSNLFRQYGCVVPVQEEDVEKVIRASQN